MTRRDSCDEGSDITGASWHENRIFILSRLRSLGNELHSLRNVVNSLALEQVAHKVKIGVIGTIGGVLGGILAHKFFK